MYGTLAAFRSWAEVRAYAIPQGDALATAALVRASDYIKYRYVAFLCPGYDETLPVVEGAAYEAAVLEGKKPGFFSSTYTAAQQKVLTEVKGIKWTVVGESSGIFAYQPTSSIIDAMFNPFYCGPRDPNAPVPMIMAIGGKDCG